MRYPRNAKIFRGQIDAAPFAGLFFLLVLMLFIFSTHVFVPGVRVAVAEREPAPELPGRTLRVEPEAIHYKGEEHTLESFERVLRQEAKLGEVPRRLEFLADPRTPAETLEKVETLGLELGIELRPPGDRLELPGHTGFPGTAGPAVVVGINLNGQIFYQHQHIRPEKLKEKLAELRGKEGKIAVVVQADKHVRLERVMEVVQIAGAAGVDEVTIGTRPGPRQ